MGGDTHQSHRGGKRSTAGRIAEGLWVQVLASPPEPRATLNLERLRQRYAVSRSSPREAISRRSSFCFIEIEKQRNNRVSLISPGNLSKVTELRMDREPLALRKAIRNRRLNWGPNFLAGLSWLNPTARAPKNHADIETWEISLNTIHDALIALCDRPVLHTFYRKVMAMNDRFHRPFSRIHAYQHSLKNEHPAIAKTAIARDEDRAANLFARHFEKTSTALQATLRDQPPKVLL